MCENYYHRTVLKEYVRIMSRNAGSAQKSTAISHQQRSVLS